MSTFKSFGGPASGLLLTQEGALAEKIHEISFPSYTASFDVYKSTTLAITLLDWVDFG